MYLAVRHPGTPFLAKFLGSLVCAYAFSPIDLIPDFIPVLGYLDDLLLVPLGIYLTLKLIPVQILEESRAEAEKILAKPQSLLGFFLVPATWLLAAGFFWFGYSRL